MMKLDWPGVSRTALGVAQPRTGRHAYLNCRRRLKKTNADISPASGGRQSPVVQGHAAHGFTAAAGIRTRRHTAGGDPCKAERRGFLYPAAACNFHLTRKETERRLRSGGVTGTELLYLDGSMQRCMERARSNLHEFVQFRRGHAAVDETESALVFHLIYSIEKAGHCCAIERGRKDAPDSRPRPVRPRTSRRRSAIGSGSVTPWPVGCVLFRGSISGFFHRDLNKFAFSSLRVRCIIRPSTPSTFFIQ